MIKKIIGLCISIGCSFSLLLFAEVDLKHVDTIIAVINDEVITLKEFNIMLAPLYFQLKESTSSQKEFNEKFTKARTDLLKQLIEERLLVQAAIKQNITVSENEIDEQINEVRSKFANEEEFQNALLSQGITIHDLRKRYQEQAKIKNYIDYMVRMKIYIGPIEIYKYYDEHKEEFSMKEQVHLYSILIRADGARPLSEVEEKVKQVMDRLKKGEDFEKLAQQYSEGPNAEKGGDMGMVSRGDLIKELDEIVFSLPEGKVNEPVRSRIGFHIFKVKQHVVAQQTPLAEVENKIKAILFKEKAQEKYAKLIQRLKDEAYISMQ